MQFCACKAKQGKLKKFNLRIEICVDVLAFAQYSALRIMLV